MKRSALKTTGMDSSEVTLNLEKVCRVCLTENEEMHSLFSQITQEDCAEEEEACYLYQMLMSISSMKVSVIACESVDVLKKSFHRLM